MDKAVQTQFWMGGWCHSWVVMQDACDSAARQAILVQLAEVADQAASISEGSSDAETWSRSLGQRDGPPGQHEKAGERRKCPALTLTTAVG